jgi:hypothetical protein
MKNFKSVYTKNNDVENPDRPKCSCVKGYTKWLEQKLNIAVEALEKGIIMKQSHLVNYKNDENCLCDIEDNNEKALKKIKGEM